VLDHDLRLGVTPHNNIDIVGKLGKGVASHRFFLPGEMSNADTMLSSGAVVLWW
jgi:hypothetical protein